MGNRERLERFLDMKLLECVFGEINNICTNFELKVCVEQEVMELQSSGGPNTMPVEGFKF